MRYEEEDFWRVSFIRILKYRFWGSKYGKAFGDALRVRAKSKDTRSNKFRPFQKKAIAGEW